MAKSRIDPVELVLSELRDFRQEFRDERDGVNMRLIKLETDVSGAKLLGRAALGVAACLGSFVAWAIDLSGKVLPLFHR